MNGINAHTGQALSGQEHLRQSVADILRTPLGTRLMRRDYGSRLFDLIDAPVNNVWKSECYAAVAEALGPLGTTAEAGQGAGSQCQQWQGDARSGRRIFT